MHFIYFFSVCTSILKFYHMKLSSYLIISKKGKTEMSCFFLNFVLILDIMRL